MSDTPEYILRKPLRAVKLNADKTQGDRTSYDVDKSFCENNNFDETTFEEWFMPLDKQALTEQIELLVKEARSQFLTNRQIAEREDLKDEVYEEEDRLTSEILVKQFLALFGLENKETE